MQNRSINQNVGLHVTEPTPARQAVDPGHGAATPVAETNFPQSPTYSADAGGGPDHAGAKVRGSGYSPTDLAERRQRPPAKVPSPDGRRIEISPAFLHSLFAVGPRPQWQHVDDRETPQEIAGTFSSPLLYWGGSRPDQDAGTVLLGLVRREIGQEIGREFPLPLRPFAKTLAWSDSSSSSQRCLRALRILAEGRASFRWNGVDDVEIRFIRIHHETATHAVVSFDPSFAWSFTGNRTFLDFERRTLLRIGLETWLYGIAMSNSCRNEFAMHRLHHLAGSTKLLRPFGNEAIEAVATLVRYGLIRDCHLDGTPIRVARPELFSGEDQATRASRTSPVRRDPVTYLRIVKAKSAPEDTRSAEKAVSKTERPSGVRKEPERLESGFDHEPYSSDEYDDSQPDLDDLPCGDDDE